jgi:hypothetical protein
MKKLVIILTFTLAVLGLHCYALHKRVAYHKAEAAREYSRGLGDATTAFMSGAVKILTEAGQTNELQSAFEKEVAP